jgi:hypothetical protein
MALFCLSSGKAKKYHVYPVNPWPRPGFEKIAFIIEFS